MIIMTLDHCRDFLHFQGKADPDRRTCHQPHLHTEPQLQRDRSGSLMGNRLQFDPAGPAGAHTALGHGLRRLPHLLRS